MSSIKIYSNNKSILDQVCEDYNLKPDYIYGFGGKITGEGYCSSGGYLRVFSKDSYVDVNYEETDITSTYVKTKFAL